jgi:transcription elongation factor GreB
VSRAFVKEDERGGEAQVPRSSRSHPYYITPAFAEDLASRLAAAQAAGDERAVESLTARLTEAIVVRAEDQPHDRVSFGARVTVETPDRSRSEYAIVGEDEADPPAGRISWLSPLAQALLDHAAGDRVVWQRPAGNIAVRIVAIAY